AGRLERRLYGKRHQGLPQMQYSRSRGINSSRGQSPARHVWGQEAEGALRSRMPSIASPLDTPLETIAGSWWNRLDGGCRAAFFSVVVVNVLALGFEVTNLSRQHAEVIHILVA